MRSQLLFGGVASIGLVLAVAACSGTDGTTGAAPGSDAGSSGSSGGKKPGSSSGNDDTDDPDDDPDDDKKDAGPKTEGLKSDTLAQGDQQLFAIAGEDAIYLEYGQTANTLYAVPIDGSGAPTKIADLGDADDFSISGGAVAVWTNIDDVGFGTLGVWTRATGMKSNIATASGAGAFFEASEDGSRIAFTQNLALTAEEELTSLEIGVRDTSAASNAATLQGTTAAGNAFNFAALDCEPTMGFAGKVFFAQFCPGTGADATNAKLVTVAADGTTVVRLDAATNGAAGTLKASPAFVASDDGTKVFVVRSQNSAGRFITVGGAAGGTALENDIAAGTMLPDGSAVIYRTAGNVLKKATTAATPVVTTLAAADARGILGLSRDAKHVLFYKLDPESGNPLIDVSIVDHTAATPAPVELVPTRAAYPLGLNGPSSHFVFLGDLTQTGASLKSMPITGGAAKTLGDSVGALLASTGNGAVSVSNSKKAPDPNQFEIADITYYDTVSGKSSKIADSVPDGEIQAKGKRIVYSRFAPQGSGIYAVTLP